jgi:hypothetical protein
VRCSIRHGWRRHAFRVTAAATAAALASTSVGVRAAEDVPSNLDLLARMTTEIAQELYGKFGPELGGRSVQLRPFANGEDYTFVGNVFTDVLTAYDVKTIAAVSAGGARPVPSASGATTSMQSANPGAMIDSTSSPVVSPTVMSPNGSAGAVLTYQTIAFGVSYPDVYRSHLVGGKRIKRRADVRVHATLSDAQSGEVLWVGEAARESSDEFDMDDAPRVEQGLYQFARPVLPGSGWGKLVEPVFVTGIIVGLIYLFFSNQSDN